MGSFLQTGPKILPVINGGTGLDTYVAGDIIQATAANVLGRVPIASQVGMWLSTNSSGLVAWSGQRAVLQNQQGSGVNGGTFTTGADRTATLNTEVEDLDGIVTLSSNQFTLGTAGRYRVTAWVQGVRVGVFRCWLYNITTSAIVTNGEGSCEFSHQTSGSSLRSTLDVVFSISGSTVFEIRKRCSDTYVNGTGLASSFNGAEIYGEVVIYRMA